MQPPGARRDLHGRAVHPAERALRRDGEQRLPVVDLEQGVGQHPAQLVLAEGRAMAEGGRFQCTQIPARLGTTMTMLPHGASTRQSSRKTRSAVAACSSAWTTSA